jgi:hypothetical protein
MRLESFKVTNKSSKLYKARDAETLRKFLESLSLAGQEINCLLEQPNVHYRDHKSIRLDRLPLRIQFIY